MSDDKPGSAWKENISTAPAFVRLSLWGVNSRGMALFFVAISLLAALACLIWLDVWIAGAFGLAALAYYYSMNWVDRNG